MIDGLRFYEDANKRAHEEFRRRMLGSCPRPSSVPVGARSPLSPDMVELFDSVDHEYLDMAASIVVQRPMGEAESDGHSRRRALQRHRVHQ
ncbi:hypothetical protein ACP70R_008839 [Stipagrostis hirtigluma subsp. patula]